MNEPTITDVHQFPPGPLHPGGVENLFDEHQADNTGPSPEIDTETGLELRQIAGLTAGSVMPLPRGVFHFRDDSTEVGFSLHVESPTRVTVVPGVANIRIDDMPVTEPSRLGSAVLDVENARFIVRSQRKNIPSEPLNTTNTSQTIAVPLLQDNWAEVEQEPEKRGLFGGRSKSHPPTERPSALDGVSWEFLELIRENRGDQATQLRELHPHPEEILHRLQSSHHHLWTRGVDHDLFGRVSVAYADLPWEPKFDKPEAIPPGLYKQVRHLSALPSVPVTANLPIGPLGIIGHRPGVLAVARQALISIACTSQRSSFELGVFADDNFVEDWEWVNHLPQELFQTKLNSQTFVFADGVTGYKRACDIHPVAQRETGLVISADTVENLPADCGMVILVDDKGICRATNHLGETITATPLGVTEEFAITLANRITETVVSGY